MAERALLGGRYELGPAIGSGGFATVFRARDQQNNSGEVAIKLVPHGFGSKHLAARLWSEAATLKRLASRYIAKVHDFGEDASGVWLVMELVDGVPLTPEGLGRALFPHEILRVARGLLDGLASAHQAGIVHGDVKPSNILVPRSDAALDMPKLIDFGLARATSREDLAKDLGDPAPASGIVVGTARYMAPEVLKGAEADTRSDIYGAGLVMFELLGEGRLFPGDTTQEQIRARIQQEPELEGRVPPPLNAILAKMLARDPANRFKDANEALDAIVDLDTAPNSSMGEALGTSSRPSGVDMRRSSSKPAPIPSVRPSMPIPRLSSLPSALPSSLPSSLRPAPPAPKLSSLPADGVDGLRETIRHLDLAMLDALARRERGQATGRIARAVALSLRLELDAAALILEPLAMQSDIARAVGATVLAPRARRVTRARVDSDREDKWIDTIPAELAGLLVSLAAAISPREDAARDVTRCQRALDRLERASGGPESETGRRVDTLRITLRLAHTAARVRVGELDPGVALDLVKPIEAADLRPLTHFDRVVRALLAASTCIRLDEARAREALERAVRTAAESGTTLLEACAAAAWGKLLVETPSHVGEGLAVLERATTLLAHGDAPTLEHEAEHHRAAALVMQARWSDAIPHLRSAREAAHAERSIELEVLSAALEVFAHLALGDRVSSREAAMTLGEARIGSAAGRPAALAWIARSLDALAQGDREDAEDALAEARARAREAGTESADAFVLVEVLGILFDATNGQLGEIGPALAELERFAQERGFTAFYWFDVLRNVIERTPDPVLQKSMLDALARIAIVLGPQSRLARDRRTSAPPPA